MEEKEMDPRGTLCQVRLLHLILEGKRVVAFKAFSSGSSPFGRRVRLQP